MRQVRDPTKLRSRLTEAIVSRLGRALPEVEWGRMLKAWLARYRVLLYANVPEIDDQFLDRPTSAGTGETPLIAVVPAIANADFAATGIRSRSIPMRLPSVNEVGHENASAP